ncbi:MAG: leucyl aminopeptidase, partial [Candidatus Kapaibacterium sp.]
YKPKAVVDIATLTGACMIALGSVTSGLMGTDPGLIARLKESGDRTGEYVCELPLHDDYEDLIKSDVADVKNSGGRAAGAITAALFLKKFIGDYPWAHLDIAGTGIAPKDGPYSPKGGSGVGVRLFVDMLRSWK